MSRQPAPLAVLAALAFTVSCSRSERHASSGGGPPAAEPAFAVAAASIQKTLDDAVGKGRDGARAICKTGSIEESSWDFEGKALLKLACRSGHADVTFYFSNEIRILKVSAQVLSAK